MLFISFYIKVFYYYKATHYVSLFYLAFKLFLYLDHTNILVILAIPNTFFKYKIFFTFYFTDFKNDLFSLCFIFIGFFYLAYLLSNNVKNFYYF